MAEDATTLGPSIASSRAPIVDQPGRSTSESDLARNAFQLKAPLLFILDHNGDKYPIPWKQGQEYLRFKSYVEEIYARNGDEERLDQVRNDKFKVTHDAADESHVILPSLWNDFVHEGITVRISFGFDPQWRRTRSSPKDRGVEFVDTEVGIGHDRRDEPASGTESSDDETSIASDEDDTEENESVSERDNEFPEAAPAEPIRVVSKPVDEEGIPLSFTLDTRWAAKHLSAMKENDSSKDSLIKNPRNGRDMATETLRITKAVTSTTENRTTLQVYTLPGPEKSALSSSIAVRWFHMHGDALDWAQFKDTCLMLPDLSERTKLLVAKTLHKVEKENIKAFLGGMFVEPGTVLRGDECNQPNPQTVIFSCTPYFDIRKSLPSSTQTDRLHPARTLIQSYYPYEPVKERDEEQAYRRFGTARPSGLIHMPSLWMLNVNGKAVVTCGYEPLSSEFTKSIKVLQEDLKQFGAGNEDTLISFRLTDLDGRVLLYSPQECGTYFQMEQRVRELRRLTGNSWFVKVPQVLFQQRGEKIKATPSNWPAIIRQRNVIFVDLFLVEEVSEQLPSALPFRPIEASIQGSVPPFYHWPSALGKDEMGLETLPLDDRHAIRCLGQVEKAMLNETLPESDTGGPVDRTFSSTQYYESLHENVSEDVEKSLLSQIRLQNSASIQPYRNHHQFIVRAQSSKLPGKAYEFTRVVHDTLGLFVGEDVDKGALLRKVWGALANIAAVIERLGDYSGYDSDPREYSDPSWKTPKTGTRSWRIRIPTTSYAFATQHAAKFNLPLPDNDNEFGAAVKKCRRCAREAPFDDPNAALKHLRKHAATEASKQGDSASSSFIKDVDEWKDWIRNDDQALLESTIAGACAILDRAIGEARIIYGQLHELSDGVRDEKGNLADIYSFPRKLLETLHRLLVFYFAVERSLHYTEENFDQTKKGGYQADYPYTDLGLEILNRFSESVKSPLQQARVELCEMVRSSTPKNPAERLCLGAEYISSWLIRRLIVKPLEKSMTVGDMYREYLTTLQFQVNHRPGKRLLRSINLLQEELTILAQVNDWQTRLVKNYLCVLDDVTYPVDILSRRAQFPYERLLLNSCFENLALTREEYQDQIRRCGPLSESTKQSSEINEEDHGKAILVFTVVTIIFLPLSFVTSYLGMNTSDIRDMDNKQSLFWEIALPLTVSVMAIMLAIAYNGDEIRDYTSSVYRSLTGKQDRSPSARGISVLQRNRATKGQTDSATTLSIADDAEYATPQAKPDFYQDAWYNNTWDRSNKIKSGGLPDKDVLYIEESALQPRARYTQPPVQKSTFPPTQSDALPFSIHEPMSYAEPITTKTAPSPRPPRYPRAKLYDSILSDAIPPPPPSANRPTYMKIHKKYIVPSVLNEAYLPWEDDPTDPSYIIVKQYLSNGQTDALFERSKEVMEGRAPTRYDEKGRFRTDDPWLNAKYEYVWESKKDKRRKARERRRGGEWYGRMDRV